MKISHTVDERVLIKTIIIVFSIILVSAFVVYYLVGWNTVFSFLVLSLSDSVNPCTFVVYTLLLIGLSISGFRRKEVFLSGLAFVIGIYIMYYLLGVGLVVLTRTLNPIWAGFLAIGFGVYTIITGSEEKSRIVRKNRIMKLVRNKRLSILFSFLFGVIISVTLLPCSAGSYLIYAVLISKFSKSVIYIMLALYNFVFITPLLVILLITSSVVESKTVSQYLVRKSKELSFLAGSLLVLLGVLIITGILQ